MSQIGTLVQTSQSPPAVTNPYSTANAFMVGFSDWGPSGVSGVNTPATSLSSAATLLGAPTLAGVNSARSSTNATLFDACDAYFREGGSQAYVSRVLGPSPVNATLALAPSAAITLTAQYPGVGGNQIFAAVNNQTTYVIITLTDAAGNVLATSPQCTTLAQVVSWAATTGIVTATSSGSTLPSTVAATALSGGTDDRTHATLASWTTAINAFGASLGPGQIMAPGQTNTILSGIWTALLTHGQANNRVAILDETDDAAVSTVQSDITTSAIPSGLQGYGGVWAGNRNIPGVTSGTTRSVPPSAVIAALCARVDQTGNPNLPPAGQKFALQYATSPTSYVSGSLDTYSLADLETLNSSGVNGFQNRFTLSENYGFVTLVPPTSDGIYWQFNHARLRMAIVADLQVASEPFYASQADGQGADITEFNTALQGVLMKYFTAGALYGAQPTDAFTVNTGPSVNTPALLQAGQLSAQLSARFSPGIQLVVTVLNAVAITQTLTQLANPAQGQ